MSITGRARLAHHEREDGFTLLELMTVMLILGVLAAIAIPVVLNQRHKAMDATLEADLRNFAVRQGQFLHETRYYGTRSSVESVTDRFVDTPGNFLDVIGGVGTDTGFCAVSYNYEGSERYWNSEAGGLLKKGVTCGINSGMGEPLSTADRDAAAKRSFCEGPSSKVAKRIQRCPGYFETGSGPGSSGG